MQIGMLGYGKMGKILSEKLMDEGHQVVVWNRSREVLEQLRTDKAEYIVEQKLLIAHSVDELQSTLNQPRIFWSMLPSGEPTNTMMQQLFINSQPGDIIIDGGNSYFKDTERWVNEFHKKGVKFLGLGISGGIHAIENGFCIMAGGDEEAYTYCTPLFDSLITPYGAYNYFGPGGAGHYVKMVHNGIEYGIMQALGEGFGVLARSNYRLDLDQIVSTWQGGSIVQGFLLDMVQDALAHDPGLAATEGIINANGEGKWTVEQAHELGVPVPVIEQSLEFRNKSQYDGAIQATFAAKLVAALRKEFGGHAIGAAPVPNPLPNNSS